MRSRENGVITRALRGVGLQFSPPFVTTPEQLHAMAEGMSAGIRDMTAQVVYAQSSGPVRRVPADRARIVR